MKISASTFGAFCAYTLEGPPDKITALGFLAFTSAAVIEDGTISEKTCASRTRRAISCAYCAPKSTTRTPRVSATMNKNLYALELLHI